MNGYVVFLCFAIGWVEANFHRGDYVQTSRRGQFHGQRTSWHDLQGRHCPRFGIDATVAVPLPKPKAYDQLEEYKIQLAFDHERLLTSWAIVLAQPNTPGAGLSIISSQKLKQDVLVPFIRVQLWKRNDALVNIRVDASRLPDPFVKNWHPEILEEYKNRDQWPKHVLVKYEWVSVDEVDAERGLAAIIFGGMIFIFIMIFGVVLTSQAKFEDFWRELTSDTLQAPGKEENKAE